MNPDNWASILIEGKHLPRIKYTAIGHKDMYCPTCNVTKNSLHKLGCDKEYSPCDNHKYLIDCECDVFLGEPI